MHITGHTSSGDVLGVGRRRSEMTIIGWAIQCHNEWCSWNGNTFEFRDDKPTEKSIPCPSCGWPAMLNLGYKPIYEEESQ